MNPLVLGLLAWGAYTFFIKDRRPAQFRAEAQELLNAAVAQDAASPGAGQALRMQAQELLAAAAAIESGALKGMGDNDDLGGLGLSFRRALRHLNPVTNINPVYHAQLIRGDLHSARRIAHQMVLDKQIAPSEHDKAVGMALQEIRKANGRTW